MKAIMKTLQILNSSMLLVILKEVLLKVFFITFDSISFVLSLNLINSFTLLVLISNPIVLYFLANSIDKGNPT